MHRLAAPSRVSLPRDSVRERSAREALAERLALYLIADPDVALSDLVATVEAAISGGATAVQLRAKRLTDREALALARALKERCDTAGTLFIVNDRLDLALAAGADGVHLGVDDLPIADARRLAGPNFVIGYSPETDEQTAGAKAAGADYLGVGAVFGTASKSDAGPPIGLGTLHRRVNLAGIPVIGIGGIGAREAGRIVSVGAVGVAVAGAILRAPNPEAAARALRDAVERAKTRPASRPPVPRLMLVTDRSQARIPLVDLVRRSLDGGVDLVQIREKVASSEERARIIEELLAADIPPEALAINEDVEVALRYGVGLHLPEAAVSPSSARDLVGPHSLVGRSVHSPEAAKLSNGADFLVAGHVFPTASKPDRPPLGLSGLREIVTASPVPVLAIGGMTAERAAEAIRAGAWGVAVMSNINAAPDPCRAAQELRNAIDAAMKG